MATSDRSSIDEPLADEPLAALTIDVRDQAVYAAVHGEIDMSNSRKVIDSLLAAAEGSTGLVLDISAVGFMDSHTIAGLHRLWQSLTAAGRRLLIVTGRNTPTERVLLMSGMDQVLPLEPGDGERQPF